ncbi:hypothetical protein PtA15_11A409 [Puccinia triticina]|uniref:DEAD/DEAH box helicase n=1 Tax=Puccinia triticina TaxID=208348 RepID=A0ABY7CXT7_9BASI|nr:uncharacterized protein PtA15_11A409 [Puccinia triticina]WAQ89718.1 hypothetical protein PtA15_11A409 [Puccinia triticina]WAR59763.1 hypothetical protein PtB15_11B404 [Puccinia triticina]
MPPRKKLNRNNPPPEGSASPPAGHRTKRRKRTDSPAGNAQRAWPPFFQQLQPVYQALNTVFTFCSTRKHLHTTIENMRSSVEGLIKCPLELESVAQIKTLLPDLIRFTYVDKDTLGALDEISAPSKQQRNTKNLNIYDPQPSRSGHAISEEEAAQVLLFQFLDGELKTAQKHARKLPSQHARLKSQSDPSTRPTQDTLTAQDLLTPSYSPKMMIKMVEKRNLQFKEAVEELLEACAAEDPPVDPAQLLIECAISNNPLRRESTEADPNISKLPPNLGSSSSEVPTIESVLEQLKASPNFRGQIVENGEYVTPARQACFQDLERSQLSPQIIEALQSTKGITRLYSHQARAIDLLAERSNVIVTTSTSSGKSLIYQIPMLQALEKSHTNCGLYIFPTKALAQDQKRSLDQLILSYGQPLSRLVRVETYDGDTPSDDRAGIRKHANVIFTNPDMLHWAILPNEEHWRRFFQNLRFVVVDELHIYAGIFGAHVAMIMRRLRRVCEAVGNEEVRFISCSATTTNPEAHMKSLFGFNQVSLVSEDGAPSGAKRHVIWNPPLVDSRDPGAGRVSAIVETSRVFRLLLERGVRTIVFCRIRRTCELLMKQVQEDLVESGRRELKGRVRAYRGGYTAQERRLIESEMFSGELLGIVATTALELGIDIGGLDAVISLGFPHSLSGLIQQAGRAGRRSKDSLAMLVLEQRGLDQHFANHPEELFDAQGTSVSLDLHNPRLLLAHLHCAAYEIPVVPAEDTKFFGPKLPDLCLEHLARDDQGFFHTRQSNPSQLVSIRGLNSNTGLDGSSESYTIIDISVPNRPKILEEIERDRVLFECFEGAIFLHQGSSLLVVDLNHPLRSISVRAAAVHFLTQPIVNTLILPDKVFRNFPILPDSSNFVFYGNILITTRITGYLKLDAKNRAKVLDRIELPAAVGNTGEDGTVTNVLSTKTVGVWIDLPTAIIQSLVSIFKPPHSASLPHPSDESSTDLLLPSSYYPKINLVIHLLEHLILYLKFSSNNKKLSDQDPQDPSHKTESARFRGPQQPHTLKTSCPLFKSSSPKTDSQRGFHNGGPWGETASHEEIKLIDRLMIYEDPKKNLDRSIVNCSYNDVGTSDDDVSGLKDLATNVEEVLTQILSFLEQCSCVHGCLSCIFKPICPHLVFPASITKAKNNTPQSTTNPDQDPSNDHDNHNHCGVDDELYRGVKFGVLVLANGLLDRVWVPEE